MTKRYCGPTCSVIVDIGTKCLAHQKSAFNRAESTRRSGRWLQRQRWALWEKNPHCALCGFFLTTPKKMIRDHIIPLAEGGEDIASNTQALCRACSDRKSEAEARRGTARYGR